MVGGEDIADPEKLLCGDGIPRLACLDAIGEECANDGDI
jgi:hypothetical protein